MRVLSIDGGGIRGVIPAMVLAEVERRTGRRIHELFDLIAGTSTGGILACALTKPQPQTAEELVGLYVDEGPRIFHRDLLKRIRSVEGFLDERYDDDGLNGALREHLGDARLQQALTPMVVTAYADVAPAGPIELIASLGTGSKKEDHPIRGAEGWGSSSGPGRSSTWSSTAWPTPSTTRCPRCCRRAPTCGCRPGCATRPARSTTPRRRTCARCRARRGGSSPSAPPTSTRCVRRSPHDRHASRA